MKITPAILAVLLLILVILPVKAKDGLPLIHIRTVGCPSDGQVGPQAAPPAGVKSMRLDPAIADHLVFYQAADGYGGGVLGPRGWHCVNLYGSNGSFLVVTKDVVTPVELFQTKRISGPAIQLSFSSGGTSGRFDVAQAIARYFPAQKKFLDEVVAEKIEPRSSFPSGFHPNDRLLFRNATVIEFETPAHTQGIGTDSRLSPGDFPIRVIAKVEASEDGDWPDLAELDVRLPPQMTYLIEPIIRQAFPNIARPK